MLEIKPIILYGKHIVLRPPSINDIEGLTRAARDGEIRNNHFSQFPKPNEIPTYIRKMVELQKRV